MVNSELSESRQIEMEMDRGVGYSGDDEEHCGHRQKLISFCTNSKRMDPVFMSRLEQGLYWVCVRVGEEVATSSGSFVILGEAEESASKL